MVAANGTFNVFTPDKTNGKSNMIITANEKGRLFSNWDKAEYQAATGPTQAKEGSDSYAHNFRNALVEGKVPANLEAGCDEESIGVVVG